MVVVVSWCGGTAATAASAASAATVATATGAATAATGDDDGCAGDVVYDGGGGVIDG